MKRYPIAICMAGAVSAGTYSAGAMAVLLEAIRRWEDANLNLPSRPKHRISIKGMSGASAGSVQAALSSLEIFSKEQSRELGKEAWLSVDLTQLLNLSDIENGSFKLQSVLNTDVLRAKTTDVLNGFEWVDKWPDYIDDEFEVRLSVTNLRGVPYNVKLPSTNRVDFGMSQHNEYLHFHFSKDEVEDSSHFTVTVKDNPRMDTQLEMLTSGALASSAFPVAFEPVEINRPQSPDTHKDIHDLRTWLKAEDASSAFDDASGTKTSQINYSWTDRSPAWNTNYGVKNIFYAVDGGVTNNEPILEAFKILAGDHTADWSGLNKLDSEDLDKDGRVIMIDPFPNSLDRRITDKKLRIDSLLSTIRSALIGHARFSEPIMVSDYLKDRVGLVYPSNPLRESDNDSTQDPDEQMLAIKSGALAGFSGFLKKDFLEHDYELGRLNMQRFLRYHFTVPASHKLVDGDTDFIEQFGIDKDGEKHVPIIPVYHKDDSSESFSIFNMPESEKEQYYRDKLIKFDEKFTRQDKKDLKRNLNKRLGKVVTELMSAHDAGFMAKFLWNRVLKGKLTKAIVGAIENSLRTQKLLDYDE